MVAITSAKGGHDATLLLAADAVHTINYESDGDIVGQGTRDVRVHPDVIKDTDKKYEFQECLLRLENMKLLC